MAIQTELSAEAEEQQTKPKRTTHVNRKGCAGPFLLTWGGIYTLVSSGSTPSITTVTSRFDCGFYQSRDAPLTFHKTCPTFQILTKGTTQWHCSQNDGSGAYRADSATSCQTDRWMLIQVHVFPFVFFFCSIIWLQMPWPFACYALVSRWNSHLSDTSFFSKWVMEQRQATGASHQAPLHTRPLTATTHRVIPNYVRGKRCPFEKYS